MRFIHSPKRVKLLQILICTGYCLLREYMYEVGSFSCWRCNKLDYIKLIIITLITKKDEWYQTLVIIN